MRIARCAEPEGLPGRGPSFHCRWYAWCNLFSKKTAECVLFAHQGKLENQLARTDHPEFVPRDSFDGGWVRSERFDLPLQAGDLVNQLLVGAPKILQLFT